MTSTERELRRAAFGDDPGVPDTTLARAELGGPMERWLAAVVLGGRGRYARAAALLEPMVREADPVLGSLAAGALAAHRRQLGGHADARGWDARALRLAAGAVHPEPGSAAVHPELAAAGVHPEPGSDAVHPEPGSAAADPDGLDAEGALADALLGLAADALALGRESEARRLIARVHPRSWRTQVRAGWVHAELELAAGAPASARAPAERAAALAREHGALRHVVKSDLVLAAALMAASSELDRAAALVDDALGAAVEFGLDSLCWPAELIAAGLRPDRADEHHRRARAVLRRVLPRADPAGRRIAIGSVWVPME